MKTIDLHVHSNVSDGTLTPTEIALYAKKKGLSAIALTDHDTVDGLKECMQKGEEIGLMVIPGIEFSAGYCGKEFHILGYYINPENVTLQAKLKEIISNRQQRNQKMLKKLADLGMPLTLKDLQEGHSPNTVFTRAHFAEAMLRKGYVESRKEAFSKYLGSNGPCFVARDHLSVKECISLIHEAGGLAVLAHPMLYGYSRQEITELLKVFIKDQLDGVEVLYSTHSKEDITHLLQICLNLKLFPTGGSDFHGENKPHLDMGTGYGELQVPFELLDALHKRLHKA